MTEQKMHCTHQVLHEVLGDFNCAIQRHAKLCKSQVVASSDRDELAGAPPAATRMENGQGGAK